MNMIPVEEVDPKDCTFDAALAELERELAWREANWEWPCLMESKRAKTVSRMQRLRTAISIVRGRMFTPNMSRAVRPRIDLLIEWDDKSSVMHSGHFSSVAEVGEYLRAMPGDRNFRWWINGISDKDLATLLSIGDSYALYSPPNEARGVIC